MTDEIGEISHTNPYTDESFGERVQVFDRGTTIAADGGRDEEPGDDTERNVDEETMEDVDHEPPNDSESANRVYKRGTDGRDDSV
jgi:hypothetical protein